MACKGKYKDIAPVLLDRISKGDSNAAACRYAGVSTETFYKWLNCKVEFSDAIKNARETFRTNIQAKLESTLWEKALGGRKIEEITTEYAAGPKGEPIIVRQKKTTKTMNSDTGALIFALTNIAPEKWKNKQIQDVNATVSGQRPIIVFDEGEETGDVR